MGDSGGQGSRSALHAGDAAHAAPVGAAAAIGALGIVFGDIGTSGLYTYQQVVTTPGSRLDQVMVLGTVSMLIWSLTLVVTVLYVRLLMRTDNAGEGGLLALFGLLRLRGAGSSRQPGAARCWPWSGPPRSSATR